MPKEIINFNIQNYSDKFIKNLYNKSWQDYHYDKFRAKNLNFAHIINKFYNPKSVIDFGCSVGTYLEVFLKNGKDIRGYEYCYEESLESIRKVPNLENYISFGDVTKTIPLNRKYDCAISIEVAEHIPTKFSPKLVENLTNATDNIIIFTAAKPGQGGTGHINCQPKKFWLDLFAKKGFYLHEDTNKIKNIMKPSRFADKENELPYIWKHVYENLIILKKKN